MLELGALKAVAGQANGQYLSLAGDIMVNETRELEQKNENFSQPNRQICIDTLRTVHYVPALTCKNSLQVMEQPATCFALWAEY